MPTQLTTGTSAIATINRVAIGTLGLIPIGLSGWLSQPAWEREGAPLTSRYGSLPIPYLTVGPRTIVMDALLVCPSIDRVTPLETLRRALTGRLELSTMDAAHTLLWAHCTGIEVNGIAPELIFADDSIAVRLTFTCFDSARYRRYPTLYTVRAGAPASVASGTLPSVAVYTHNGPHTGPLTMGWRAASRILMEALTITTTLTSTQRLEIDMQRKTFTRYTDTNIAVRILTATITSGVFPSFAARDAGYNPRDEREAWPTFEISTGSGLLSVREAWAQ